ncbi:MAG: hypothetical protein AAFU55_15475, partial [Pseudomonadota bacterium]
MRDDLDQAENDFLASLKERSADIAPAVLLRLAPAVAIAVICLYLIGERLEDLTLERVLDALAAKTPASLALAALFASLSLLALSCYDLIAAPAMNARARVRFKAPWPRLLRGGFAGSVFAQSLGLGVLTGAIARMRIYRANGATAYQAGALSLTSALGFIAGGLCSTAVLAFFAPDVVGAPYAIDADGVRAGAFAVIAVVVSLAALRAGGGRSLVHTMGSLGLFTLFAGADLAFAALAFAVL